MMMKNQIGHNSANFEATTSRFCMAIDLNDTYRIMMMMLMIIIFIREKNMGRGTPLYSNVFPSAYSFTNKQSNNLLLFSQTFCLTKAYNFFHLVAIKWTSLGMCHPD